MTILLYFMIAISVGLVVTGWQGYKDTPYENFNGSKYIRSYIVALLLIPILFLTNSLHRNVLSYPIIFLLALSLERAIGEIYKGFIRGKSHEEYIHLINKLELNLNDSNKRRLFSILAVIVLTIALIVLNAMSNLLSNLLHQHTIVLGGILGLLGGSISAIGGAIKDAQFEGFKIKKFVRSPIVGFLGGILLSKFIYPSPLLFIIALTGFERLVVELYKTFITRQVRGIHEHIKNINKYWLSHRKVFLFQYIIGLSFFISLFFIS